MSGEHRAVSSDSLPAITSDIPTRKVEPLRPVLSAGDLPERVDSFQVDKIADTIEQEKFSPTNPTSTSEIPTRKIAAVVGLPLPARDPAEVETAERKKLSFAASFDQLVESNLRLVRTLDRFIVVAYLQLFTMLFLAVVMFVVVLQAR